MELRTRKSTVLTLALAFALAASLLAACGPAPVDPPNVILVLVDTLRADHMSLYDYERETTPRLDVLAARGAVFEQARSQAACTFPSANVILTSTPMITFLGRSSDDEGGVMGIPPHVPTLAETFRDAGYRTAAVSASPIVRNTPGKHNPGGGFGAGFEFFDESCTWLEADCVINEAYDWLGTVQEGPYFRYLHFMEPHGYFRPEDVYFSGEYTGDNPWIAKGDPNPIIDSVHGDGEEVHWTDADLEHLMDLYDDEIRSLDTRMAPFLEQQLADGNTLVSLVSDHGESFLEKDHMGHCRSVWDADVRIPLLFLGPGIEPVRWSRPVEAMDLAPTLVELARLEAPETFRGSNLAPIFRTQPADTDASAMSEASRWRSLVKDRYKVVELRSGDGKRASLQLFDIVADPRETNDLAGDKPDVAQELLDLLLARTAAARGNKKQLEAERELDEHIEQLRALGYLE